jgi:UDP-N-acetylmuramoyl-tripeptide--D-alanyl-D-alanine ligase
MRNIPLSQVAQVFSLPQPSSELISGYQIDSRLVGPGDLFFALKGEKTDGHFFLKEVKAKGAIAAVVSKNYQGPDFGLTLFPVDDPTLSLADLARYFLSSNTSKIVGITGSVGKTTVKDFTATLLQSKYSIHKSLSSYNTKLTLPLSLLNRSGNEDVIVIEMGMSEPNDIEKLLQIVSLDVAVLTKVSLAHSAFFPGGIEEIAHEKGKIFSSPKLKSAILSWVLSIS